MKSLKQLYRCGMGPSSSHTIGVQNACKAFFADYPQIDEYEVIFYASLAKTGKGHHSDKAVTESFPNVKGTVKFDCEKHSLPHPNTLDIIGYKDGKEVARRRAMSVGGGAVKVVGRTEKEEPDVYPHKSFGEISAYCKSENIRLYEYAEQFDQKDIRDYVREMLDVMLQSVERGLKTEGVLEGGLDVVRKAKTLFNQNDIFENETTRENRLVCSFAFAVSEENAAGGRIVTAPTCGSAGVLPAVLYYFMHKYNFSHEQAANALLTAGVIGNIVKTNASISGAECGCQAEIGTACSMAAAALGELLNLDIDQIEYAAEVSLEHHLGLTCDPIMGLVQIPCIERNAVAAMRAINAVSLANFLTYSRKISFDTVVATMYRTGKDLSKIYRETAEGGLAKLYDVNHPLK